MADGQLAGANAPATDKKNRYENMFKPIDQASLEKNFKDRDFEVKERQELENLQMAVEFIK
jgi:predicted DNA binding CopG/RHH family protein